jgi:predicted metal-dependent phosphoesterase TrpH
LLSPVELVQRARANGVHVLALTDHDEVAGLATARHASQAAGIQFINGLEISVTWQGISVHIVGLGIDPHNKVLAEGLNFVRESRTRRARKIADSLEQAGIPGCFEGALSYAENPNLVSRTHFARFLVDRGYARDVRTVFQRYLVSGKPGYVPHEWATLVDAVNWIKVSGGAAVVAHPGRYKISRVQMRELLGEFQRCGGTGIEVVTGSHAPEQYIEYANIARDFGLMASRGSDFHGPGESRVDLGLIPDLPDGLKPIWHDW